MIIRKRLYMCVLLIFCASIHTSAAHATGLNAPNKQGAGDVNGDSMVDAVDVQLVINSALGIDIAPFDGDVNGDNSVDAVDVQLVINAALGLTTTIGEVIINEALTHTDAPAVDAIEFHNPTDGAVDIRGWFITDNPNAPKKAQIPDVAIFNIAPGGFATIDENTFGFNPGAGLSGFFLDSTGGEGVYLYSADGSGNLTGYSHGFAFGAAENGVSFGRHVTSDGQVHFVAQRSNTFGSENAGPRIGPVVISEINYNPGPGSNEYLELTNISAFPVQLWDTLDDGDPNNTFKVNGIGYFFPVNITIPANGGTILIVDTADPSRYNTPFGPFGVSADLANDGESVTLQLPDKPDELIVPYIDMDRVKFDDDPPWPNADGNGLALKRIDNNAYGNDPANWQAVTPTYVANP